MKLLIAGSRSYSNQLIRVVTLLDQILDSEPSYAGDGWWDRLDITEVISGCASGIDHAGIVWAENHSIPVKKMPADWKKFGVSAGFKRNEEMAKLCDYGIIIWDGKSHGTNHMTDMMNKYDKEFLLWTKLPVKPNRGPRVVSVAM